MTATRPRWTAPPLWPEAPTGWTPPVNWRPATSWAPAPHDWTYWRCPGTAADPGADAGLRSTDLDDRIRPYIADPVPAGRLISFLDEIRGIGDAALHGPDAAAVTRSPSRVRLLRSISSAAQVLTHASGRGAPAPFVFFACVQDAFTAAAMFAAELSRRPDSRDTPVPETQVTGRKLFDGTVARIMTVFNRAVADIGANRATASAARRALRELDEVRRLVEMAGSRPSMPIGDLLPIIEALDACGRRAAATLGVTY